MILVPLAHHLGATAVLSIVMALFVFDVIWETLTSMRCGAHIWERWSETSYPEEHPVQEETFKVGPGYEMP